MSKSSSPSLTEKASASSSNNTTIGGQHQDENSIDNRYEEKLKGDPKQLHSAARMAMTITPSSSTFPTRNPPAPIQPLPSNPNPTSDNNDYNNTTTATKLPLTETKQQTKLRTLAGKIFWTPPWCRWDPDHPPAFSIWHNVLFGFAGAFTVANLYYSHPILNILADDFNVSHLTISRLPTLMQGGYAVGLLFLCPLGDLFPRRVFTLTLVFFTATLWIVLCLTNSFNVFLGVAFITAITTVTPQIMLPLVGELAPPAKKAFCLSIVVSGNLLGIVIARILSGVVTNYTSWRNIYWLALGLQYLIFTLLYLFMPAYPATNPTTLSGFWKTYPKLLWSILVLVKKHPVLTQAGLVSYCFSAAFTSYWTTLTFLLSSPIYNLSPVAIGLFGLIGALGILLGPLYAQYIIQPLRVPMYSVLIGNFVTLLGICLGTYTGSFTLAGPIIQAFLLDAGMQFTQIANRTSIYAVEPNGRNRVNTAFMVLSFLGQLTGTSAGNKIFQQASHNRSSEAAAGWIASGSLSVGLIGVFCNLVCLVRGPYEDGWFGWSGGWGRTDNRKEHESEEDIERPGNMNLPHEGREKKVKTESGNQQIPETPIEENKSRHEDGAKDTESGVTLTVEK